MSLFVAALCLSALASSSAFMTGSQGWRASTGLSMATATSTATTMKPVQAPDFYWEFRLNRLVEKKGKDYAFDAKNYPDHKDFKELYEVYYLDLVMNGKMADFDYMAEKYITDSEWMQIYDKICEWTSVTHRANKGDPKSLPSDDLDLLQQIYPDLNMRDLNTPFAPEEMEPNFPYRSMRDLLTAAADGTLKIPGVSADKMNGIDVSETRKALAALKEKTMKDVDASEVKMRALAKDFLPDETARAHYKNVKAKLASFPQSPAAWETYRANMEKEIDEMARLASKKVEHHHHHEEGDDHHEEMSPAQEFEQKYGRSLDEMAERLAKFKSDPSKFLEKTIVEKYGQSGLDIWKKSQEFSEKMGVMSSSDKASTEAAFADFLKQV